MKSFLLICILSGFCFGQQQAPALTPQQAVSGLLNAQTQMQAQNSAVLNQLVLFIMKQDSIIQIQQKQIEQKAGKK